MGAETGIYVTTGLLWHRYGLWLLPDVPVPTLVIAHIGARLH